MRISGRTAGAIADSIERMIGAGSAVPTLPTVRALATHLRVSPATVAAAYKLLQSRGLAAGDRRRGTRLVVPGGIRTTAEPQAVPPDAVDLSSGLPDPLLLATDLPSVQMLPQDAAPIDPSLLAFAAGEFEADGVPPREIAVTAGALDAIERIVWEQLRAGDRVAVEDPSTPEIRELLTTSGFVPVPIALDAQGPDPESVASACAAGCRAVVMTPRAQNPTGAAVTRQRAGELRKALRAHPQILLIENDYAAPIAGAPFEPIRTGAEERWAVIRSTSTSLGADLRLALVAGDDRTIRRVRQRQALGARWVSRIIQRLVLAAWSDPAGGRRLARAAEIYALRRASVTTALARQGIDVMAVSGFNIWVPVREETATVMALRARGWVVAAGERFRMRTGPAIRITTSALDAATARRLTDDLADVLRPVRKR